MKAVKQLRTYGEMMATRTDRHGAEWVLSYHWFVRRRLLGELPPDFVFDSLPASGGTQIEGLRDRYARRQWSDGEVAYAVAPWFDALHHVCGPNAVCWQPRLQAGAYPGSSRGRWEPISWWTADDRTLLAVLMPRLIVPSRPVVAA